jgi:hypothetical protein
MSQPVCADGLAHASSGIQALLSGLIDYAGLFPPTALSMKDAANIYAREQNGPYARTLGRFIVPCARLQEFEDAVFEQIQGNADWRLSVLMGPDLEGDLGKIAAFQSRHIKNSRVRVESLELKAATMEEIRRAGKLASSEFETYIELPLSEALPALLVAVREAGLRAKVRTGGETEAMFPSCASLARFLHECVRAGVLFKATAGLHHPIRSRHRLTYAPDSPTGVMHGFLNVFVAAAFAQTGSTAGELEEILQEESPDAFSFDNAGIVWKERKLSVEDILSARRKFSVSFGSCSFQEPVEDLRTIHLL